MLKKLLLYFTCLAWKAEGKREKSLRKELDEARQKIANLQLDVTRLHSAFKQANDKANEYEMLYTFLYDEFFDLGAYPSHEAIKEEALKRQEYV